MLIDSLGFAPDGDSLSLFEGKRPPLRIKDLKGCLGQEVELVVRVVDARQKAVRQGRKYFFLFEDETGLLEGVGSTGLLPERRGQTGWKRKAEGLRLFLSPALLSQTVDIILSIKVKYSLI